MPSPMLDDVVNAWLRRVTSVEAPPPSVVAFNIGLLETDDGFSAYLTGSEHFDPDDGDWACEEAFTPRERYVALPARRQDTKWREVLDGVAGAVGAFLASAEGATSYLASAQAVTVGFDDGDLIRVR